MRPLEVNIDLNALKHNLSRVKVLAPKSKIMAVLKANAYGHGLIEAARAMNSSSFSGGTANDMRSCASEIQISV